MAKEMTKLPKFEVLAEEDNCIKYNYGNIYRVEETAQSHRLVVGADKDQVRLLIDLAGILNLPYYVLYVLVVSRLENERARYQSPLFDTIGDLSCFLNKYADFFETDGRHHIWIGTLDGSGLLVYDQHNVIYVYGDIESYIQVLTKKGFEEKDFYFPANHCHNYHPANDKFEESLLDEFEWQTFPLAENDEYD